MVGHQFVQNSRRAHVPVRVNLIDSLPNNLSAGLLLFAISVFQFWHRCSVVSSVVDQAGVICWPVVDGLPEAVFRF